MNLVVGATGNLGGAVCEALRGDDKPVRAMVRESSDRERVWRLEELGGELVPPMVACVDNPQAHGQTIELGGPAALSPLEVVRLAGSISGRELTVERVPADELERQAREAAGTDAAIFPSLMLCQTRGDKI